MWTRFDITHGMGEINVNMLGNGMDSQYLTDLCHAAESDTIIKIRNVKRDNQRVVSVILLPAILRGYRNNPDPQRVFVVIIEGFGSLEDKMNRELHATRLENSVKIISKYPGSLKDEVRQLISKFDDITLHCMAVDLYRTRNLKGCQKGVIHDLAAVLLKQEESIDSLSNLGVTRDIIDEYQNDLSHIDELYEVLLQSKNYICL